MSHRERDTFAQVRTEQLPWTENLKKQKELIRDRTEQINDMSPYLVTSAQTVSANLIPPGSP